MASRKTRSTCFRTLLSLLAATLLVVGPGCGKSTTTTSSSSGSTSVGTIGGSGATSTSGSGSGSTTAASSGSSAGSSTGSSPGSSTGTTGSAGPFICGDCAFDVGCGDGGYCVGPHDGGAGHCALPCDNNICAVPGTACFTEGNNQRGCFPNSESCARFDAGH